MAVYAIGDIHGCLSSLTTLVEALDLSKSDTLITLGDYVDRGPDSKGCIEFLIDLKKEFQVFCLRGNHEVMMMAARSSRGEMRTFLSVGGEETMESYGTKDMEKIPAPHWGFINSTLPYYESDTHIFVHGGLDSAVPLENQSDWDLYWKFFDRPAPHVSGKTMVCGHSSQHSGIPLSYGHATCVDTFAYGGGWLTGLNVETGHYLQANETGEVRKDVLIVSECKTP